MLHPLFCRIQMVSCILGDKTKYYKRNDVGFVYSSEISLKRLATFREYMFNSPKRSLVTNVSVRKLVFILNFNFYHALRWVFSLFFCFNVNLSKHR